MKYSSYKPAITCNEYNYLIWRIFWRYLAKHLFSCTKR